MRPVAGRGMKWGERKEEEAKYSSNVLLKSIASEDGHYVVPMALLCVLCVTATFSSLLYAITIRADIEALTARISSLESRGCCPGLSSSQPIKNIDDNSPKLPDNMAEEGQLPSSNELHNGTSFGEESLKSLSNPIFPDQDTPSWSLLLALLNKCLHSKRESHGDLPPAGVPEQLNQWKKSLDGTSYHDEVTKGDAIEGKFDSLQNIQHESQIRNRLKRSTSQNREFMNEEEIGDGPRSDRRRGGRRREGTREDSVLRGNRITGSAQILAMHFGGNTSKYRPGHRHYAGNGRLRHPDGILRDWRMKEWSSRLNRQHNFQESEGTLTIRESGIYFVYAQIYYLDDHDVNGFHVMVNESPVLQCTTMTHGDNRTKANTCFTGGMVELHAGDTILLRDVEAMRYSLFEPEKSFFGLFRIAHLASGPREGL